MVPVRSISVSSNHSPGKNCTSVGIVPVIEFLAPPPNPNHCRFDRGLNKTAGMVPERGLRLKSNLSNSVSSASSAGMVPVKLCRFNDKFFSFLNLASSDGMGPCKPFESAAIEMRNLIRQKAAATSSQMSHRTNTNSRNSRVVTFQLPIP